MVTSTARLNASTSRKTFLVVDTAAFAVSPERFEQIVGMGLATAVPDYFATLYHCRGGHGFISYVAMDLLGFLNVTRANLPELADAIDPCYRRVVVGGGVLPAGWQCATAQGLSVYGMDGLPWRENWYTAENSVSNAWYAFVEGLITHDDTPVNHQPGGDTARPHTSAERSRKMVPATGLRMITRWPGPTACWPGKWLSRHLGHHRSRSRSCERPLGTIS